MTNSTSLTVPVICAGEVLIDLIGDPAGPAGEIRHFIPRVGGAPANVASGLARLGIRSAFVGTTGGDEFGELCRRTLAGAGVETRHLRRVPEASTRLAVVTGPASDRSFRFYGQPAADELLTFDDLRAALETDGCTALYFGALPLAAEPSRSAMLTAVTRAGSRPEPIPFCFDPNPRRAMFEAQPRLLGICLELIQQARIVKVSRSDLLVLGLSDDELVGLALPDALVIVSDGRNGCRYWIDGRHGFQAAFPLDPIDETGAGDAFMAALIACGVDSDFHFAPKDIEFAAAAGALATTTIGAVEAMPLRDEIENVIKFVRGELSTDQCSPGNSSSSS